MSPGLKEGNGLTYQVKHNERDRKKRKDEGREKDFF
jgi:hypothetical protein